MALSYSIGFLIAACVLFSAVAWIWRPHTVARWIDRQTGRNVLNAALFGMMAGIAYIALETYVPEKLSATPGVFFIGLPVLGLLFSIRSLVGPKITFYARRWWQKLLKGPLRADSSGPGLTDQPIKFPKNDMLGFRRYAAILARHIIDPNEETPMTLGIHGPWGSGKTGMINLIHHYLSCDRTSEDLEDFKEIEFPDGRRFLDAWPDSNSSHRIMLIPDFNAWQYGDARSLWRALILTLIEKHRELGLPIDTRLWERHLYWSVDKEHAGDISLGPGNVIRAFFTALLPWVLHLALPTTWIAWLAGSTKQPVLGDFLQREKVKGLRRQMSSTEEFRGSIQSLVKALREGDPHRKIVFFIDDLDRCLPLVALQIVESIKAFMDIEGCVYVFACDQALLSEGVRTKLQQATDAGVDVERRGREYLEKLIQVGFEIPPVEITHLEAYCQDLCPDEVDRDRLFPMIRAASGNNPRKLKRLLSALNLSFDMRLLPSHILMRGAAFERPRSQSTDETPVSETPEPLSRDAAQETTSPDPFRGPTEAPFEDSGEQTAGATRTSASYQRDRRIRFAKVYCLRYAWPAAVQFLEAFQHEIEGMEKEVDFKYEAYVENLVKKMLPDNASDEVRNELQRDLASGDNAIFSDMLVSIDLDRIADGRSAVRRVNAGLRAFLQLEPFFYTFSPADIRDHITWSGVIPPPVVESLSRKSGRKKEDIQSKSEIIAEVTNAIGYAFASQVSAISEPYSVGSEVLVSGGVFLMGDEKQKVIVEDFYIDVYPYTNRQYWEFVKDTGYKPPEHWKGVDVPPGLEDHPVVHISYEDAVACAKWRSEKEGKQYRLPTENEWEKAARGTDGREYPWGNEFDQTRCNTAESGRNGTSSVTDHPGGRSFFGCYDMAGNVWEWTTSMYKKGESYRLLRGGSWYYDQNNARCAYRYGVHPDNQDGTIGVRFSRTP